MKTTADLLEQPEPTPRPASAPAPPPRPVTARLAAPPRAPEPEDEGETIDLAEDEAETATIDLAESTAAARWALCWGETLRELADGQPITLGRSKKADFRVEDDAISRIHLEVRAEGSSVHLRDVKGKNPATVDGVPVEGQMTLVASEAPYRLTVGRTDLTLIWE